MFPPEASITFIIDPFVEAEYFKLLFTFTAISFRSHFSIRRPLAIVYYKIKSKSSL